MKLTPPLNVLAIIPARKGSKRLPKKNVKLLSGKPLIAWTVEQACRCNYFNKVIISTDCENIAKIGKSYGAETPFLRPVEIANDQSPSMDLVHHALNFYEKKGEVFDIVVLLEPTSPLRGKQNLNEAMKNFIEKLSTHDALISVGKVEREHPSIIKKIDEKNLLKTFLNENITSSHKSEVYFPYGVIYAVKVCMLEKDNTFYQKRSLPYLIERWQNFEIDDLVDFYCTEKMMEIYSEFL